MALGSSEWTHKWTPSCYSPPPSLEELLWIPSLFLSLKFPLSLLIPSGLQSPRSSSFPFLVCEFCLHNHIFGSHAPSYGFPGVMYGCESWTIRKAERRRIDVFELWCWRRLLRVLWTAKRSNQLILKEINPEYSKDWCWSSNTSANWCEEPTH